MSTIRLSPSLLSADFVNLKAALALMEQKRSASVHIDVMDGSFVPQISYGQPVIASLRPHTKLPFDVHLMVEHPELQVDAFADCGADWITFHIEGTVHVHRLIERIKSLGKKAGIAFVPSTPVSALSEILPFVDLVLVMTVNPGFGGQAFIPSCVKKIEALAAIKKEKNLSFDISVDGGVNKATAPLVIGAGADILVSGSAFFKGEFDLESI
ncbi:MULTISPECIES: ribulose-phosphate 3-epimerase [Treponema]|uniref:ribulose-phosphate 3-epimerase n=1 Tax=Treponema TaxID=157 RepID=UPI0016526670|nr:ribulose-phosphate 3-epimerase [Treponema sp. Marseille-Q4130]MBC6719532.1 ribulose-phosphate 3-epimerase [Treponema sp. Marseille-Q4130]